MTAQEPRLFISRMSHELRTPLNAIIGFSELLRTGMVPYDSADYHRFLKHISTNGKHLLNLINDLLDMAALDMEDISFSAEPANPNKLARDVATIAQGMLHDKPMQILVEPNPILDDLMLDAVRFKQVLYNFLSNSIKYTPPNGRVRVRLLEEGPDHFRVVVTDDGIGIPQEQLPHLFDGGLGLSLVRRLVEAQGGKVGANSVQGCGSTFYAVLPRRPLTAKAAPAFDR